MEALWVNDENVTKCFKCGDSFNFLVLKHHCRKCGQVFCHSCSHYRALIPRGIWVARPTSHLVSYLENSNDINNAPQRVCFECFEALKDVQEQLRHEVSPCNQQSVESGSIMSFPAINFHLIDEVKKAMALLELGVNKETKEMLRSAQGLVFLTVIKAGAMFSGKYGTGFVVARLSETNWSPPSAVTLFGMGWGFQIGAEVQHVCFALPNRATVDAFMSKGQFSLGGEMSMSLLMGASVDAEISAGNKGVGYGHGLGVTQGLFVGVSLEATAFASRSDVNRAFYGEKINPSQILSGTVITPPALSSFHQCLTQLSRPVDPNL